MTAANPHRGEITIDLGQHGQFVLRPDFEAVAAVDAQLGGLLPLANRVFRDSAALTLDEMAVIVAEGMNGAARKEGRAAGMKVEKVKRMIFEAGMSDALLPCVLFVSNAIGGGNTETADAGNG